MIHMYMSNSLLLGQLSFLITSSIWTTVFLNAEGAFFPCWACQGCQMSLVLFLYLFLLDCVLSLLFPPVWFPLFHLCLFVFPGMMIKKELTSSIHFKFHWEPSAVRQPYLISHLLLQIKIHVRVHKTWCFSFVMRIQLKSHQNKSRPPLVFVKNLYCFLSGESQCIHLVHIAPFIFILLWHYVNSLKPTSHNLWLHCLCPLQPRTVQCGDSLLYGRERHSF